MKLYDLHVHTNLSSCASQDAVIDEYIKQAEKSGVSILGFADHAWDKNVPGAVPWYQAQPYERLFERKQTYKTDKVKVLFGAEGEFASFVLGATRETIKKLDYIIVPHSHVHFRGFVLPEGFEPHDRLAEYLSESFKALCAHPESDLIFGIAHPFYPLGKTGVDFDEILSFISDDTLCSCFETARVAGIRIELNMSCFKNTPTGEIDGYSYSRIIRAAYESGCKFFLGSDKHNVVDPEDDYFLRAPEIIKALGINESVFDLDLQSDFKL